jgi:hypothetical protein
VQVRICGIAANLAILGHEVPQLAAQLRHISSVVIAAEGNAVARPPHETAVLPVLIGIDCRSAERLAEQARCHGVTGSMNCNPLVLALGATDLGEQIVVFVVLVAKAHVVIIHAGTPAASSSRPMSWPPSTDSAKAYSRTRNVNQDRARFRGGERSEVR